MDSGEVIQKLGITTLDRDICVEAGAGAGKTKMLVDRFVHLVSCAGVPIHRIAAITFTDKAANEMKERIAGELEKLKLPDWWTEIETSFISTIHSFCARLLREYALEAGIDPQFAVMDDLKSEHMQMELLERIVERWRRKKPEAVEELVEKIAWSGGFKLQSESAFCRNLLDIYDEIRTAGRNVEDYIHNNITKVNWADNKCQIIAHCSDLKRLLKSTSLTVRTIDIINDVIAYEDKLYTLDESTPALDRLQTLYDMWLSIKLTVSKAAKPILQACKETLDKIIADVVEEALLKAKRCMIEMLAEFHRLYQSEKSESGLFDFLDLEVRTRLLLRTNPSVRESIQRKFDYILVDEFQDINLLQKQILDNLRKGNDFFAVGDPQQSIYGFRHARVEIFKQFKEETDTREGLFVPLRASYRSRQDILKLVNEVFTSVMNSGEGADATFSPLHPGIVHDAKTIPSIELLAAAGRPTEWRRQLEAETAAERIYRLIQEGECRITNPESNRYKEPVTYGDVAILFPVTGVMRVYEEALSKYSIPFVTVSGRGFYDSQEVVDIIHFLKIIVNPLYELSLAAVLRSPFVGVSDETLYWLFYQAHNGESKKRLYETLEDAESFERVVPEEKEKLKEFIKHIRYLRGFAASHSVAETIEKMLSLTGYSEWVLLEKDGKQRIAVIERIIRIARLFEDSLSGSLTDFVELFEEQRLRDARESSAAPEMEQGNAVTLMTIHAAKGLQFPIVVIADCNHKSKSSSPNFAFHPESGIACKLQLPAGIENAKPRSYQEALQLIRQREKAETLRLLYVAMTRAAEHLILAGSVTMPEDEKKKPIYYNWWKTINEIFRIQDIPFDKPGIMEFGANRTPIRLMKCTTTGSVSHAETHSFLEKEKERILAGEVDMSPVSESAAEKVREIIQWTGTPLPLKEEGDYVYSVSDVMNASICPGRYVLRSQHQLRIQDELQNEEDDDTRIRQIDDDIPYNVLGTAVHRIMALYHHNGDDLKSIIERISEENEIPEDKSPSIEKMVLDFYRRPIGKRVSAAHRTMNEASFVFDYSGYMIRGTVDLVYFSSPDEYTIVDYKSSPAAPERVSDKGRYYEIQLQLYTLALSRIYGFPPKEAFLSFLQPGIEINVGISPKDLSIVQDKLDQFLEMMRKKEYTFNRGKHCEWCEYDRFCRKVRQHNVSK